MIPEAELIGLGQTNADEPTEPFGVTQAALRLTRAANAVSRRHGLVAREMWTPLWPDLPVDEVPIGYVTNGVHLPTWLGTPMRQLLDRHLGADWLANAAEPRDLGGSRSDPRRTAVGSASATARRTDRIRGGPQHRRSPRFAATITSMSLAAARALRGDALTIGFARRVATYKRLDLLMREAEWALSMLAGDRPVQLLLAGKAHPRDDDAKRVLHRLFSLSTRRSSRSGWCSSTTTTSRRVPRWSAAATSG